MGSCIVRRDVISYRGKRGLSLLLFKIIITPLECISCQRHIYQVDAPTRYISMLFYKENGTDCAGLITLRSCCISVAFVATSHERWNHS